MSILPDFTLPSDSTITVRLREATVSDAIDFSEIDPACEEEATTLFLERIQDPAKYSDPKLWTGEDRKFALFMYKINTEQFPDLPLTYTCKICNKQHTAAVRYADMLAECVEMQGKPYRDVVHEGHAILVHPLLGRDLETIEKAYCAMREEKDKANSRKIAVQIQIMKAMYCIDIPSMGKGSELDRRLDVEKYILGMGANEFKELFTKVGAAIEDMQHGLHSFYSNGKLVFESPVVYCPETEGDPGIRLTFLFRTGELIPHI